MTLTGLWVSAGGCGMAAAGLLGLPGCSPPAWAAPGLSDDLNSLTAGEIGEKTTLKTLPVRMLTKRSSMRVMMGSGRLEVELPWFRVEDDVDTISLSSAVAAIAFGESLRR